MSTKPSCCFAMLVAVSLLSSPAQSQQPLPPARKIPGINAPDENPHACVDCHINHPEMNLDARFSTQLAQWSEKVEPGLLAKAQASAPKGLVLRGRHPRTANAVNNIPGAV